MIGLEVKDVSLVYPLRQRLALARSFQRSAVTGGTIDNVGAIQVVRALSDVSFALE